METKPPLTTKLLRQSRLRGDPCHGPDGQGVPGQPRRGGSRSTRLVVGMVVFALAVLMGFPALRGEFVGGDDHRLVLNHVLVNQPSLGHALELFTIVHRDLYQPIPLLTFQLEFVVAGWLDLFAESVEQGARLFHFDNMWLHGINALLVAAVVGMLVRGRAAEEPGVTDRLLPLGSAREGAAQAVGWTAGLLFAVHPLNVEVVAWINGRMMLLSTMFALLAMLSFARFLDRKGGLWGALTVALVVLSGISKIRAGLPILLALVPLSRGGRLDRRFWAVWPICTAIVAGLVGLNIWSTTEADFFEGGARHLQGPAAVRVLMALAFYFEHFIWPVGLSSYYPAPPVVAWNDAATVLSFGTVLIAIGVMAWFAWQSPACRWASVWFFAGIGDTLPFFPARNVLAADRYMYLPIIGLLWFAAVAGYASYRKWSARRGAAPGAALATSALVVIPTLIVICWRVAEAYTTPGAQALRIATLFPDEPRVWERLGWTHYRRGEYDRAVELAARELVHDAPDVLSGAHQLLGMAEVRRGNVEIGLNHLKVAVETDAESGLAFFRLATAYDELGRYAEALPMYEQAAAAAPLDNPTIRRLARVYRRLDRPQDALKAYEQAIANNPFDVEAVLGVSELAIESGSAEQFARAEAELVRLLRDIRSEPRLAVNLDMIRLLEGQAADAHIRLAASAFIALTDGRYEQAAGRVESLCEAGPAGAQARGWLMAQLERFDRERPNDPWTFAVSARLLIVDDQADAARMALGLAEGLSRGQSESFGAYCGRLHGLLGQ